MSLNTLGGRRLLLITALALVAVTLFFPARQLMDQRSDIEGLESRLSALTEENDRLEREVARLQEPSELEVEARERLGLVRPGESAYLVEPVEDAPSSEAGGSSGGHPFRRMWDWVVSLVRGDG